jgi:hypothetical protein
MSGWTFATIVVLCITAVLIVGLRYEYHSKDRTTYRRDGE